MVRPEVSVGEGGLQIWRVAAYSRLQLIRGDPPVSRLVVGFTIHLGKKPFFMRNISHSLGPGLIIMNDFSK
jgi:hypothetical protein